MVKKKGTVNSDSKKVHHVNVQHNFSGSAVAVVGGLLIVFALVVFIANNGVDKSGFADYSDDGSDALPTDDGSVPDMLPQEISCEESGDSGLDFTKKGTVSGVDSYGDFSWSDNCFGDWGPGGILFNLQELSCDPSTNSVVTTTHDCSAEGKICKDGACKTEKPDLIVTAVKYVSYPSTVMHLSYTIKNQGSVATPAKQIKVCASKLGGNRCAVNKIAGAIETFDLKNLQPGESVTQISSFFTSYSYNLNYDSILIDSYNQIEESNENNNNFDVLKGPLCAEQQINSKLNYDSCMASGPLYTNCIGMVMVRKDPATNNGVTSPYTISWLWNNPREAYYCQKGCANSACKQ